MNPDDRPATAGDIRWEVRRRLHEEYRGPDADHAKAAELALTINCVDGYGRHIFESQMITHAILALVYELRRAK
jgi:hypothetical protein